MRRRHSGQDFSVAPALLPYRSSTVASVPMPAAGSWACARLQRASAIGSAPSRCTLARIVPAASRASEIPMVGCWPSTNRRALPSWSRPPHIQVRAPAYPGASARARHPQPQPAHPVVGQFLPPASLCRLRRGRRDRRFGQSHAHCSAPAGASYHMKAKSDGYLDSTKRSQTV